MKKVEAWFGNIVRKKKKGTDNDGQPVNAPQKSRGRWKIFGSDCRREAERNLLIWQDLCHKRTTLTESNHAHNCGRTLAVIREYIRHKQEAARSGYCPLCWYFCPRMIPSIWEPDISGDL